MKGNIEFLKVLNSLLAEELTDINKCMIHSEMCENWGYIKFYLALGKQAIDKNHHAK